MMLIRSDDHNRPTALCHDPGNIQKPNNPVDPRCRPGPREHYTCAVRGSCHPRDFGAGSFAQPRHKRPAIRSLRVTVRIKRQDLIVDKILDLHQRPTRRHIVSIQQWARPKWPVHLRFVTNQPSLNRIQNIRAFQRLLEGFEGGHFSSFYKIFLVQIFSQQKQEHFT